MFLERRKSERHLVNSPAKFRATADAPVQDCVVMDMSDGGVRLVAEGIEVPDEFILDLDGEVGQGRPCQVVWRLDAEVGAEFLD
jgi:PilZ domain